MDLYLRIVFSLIFILSVIGISQTISMLVSGRVLGVRLQWTVFIIGIISVFVSVWSGLKL